MYLNDLLYLKKEKLKRKNIFFIFLRIFLIRTIHPTITARRIGVARAINIIKDKRKFLSLKLSRLLNVCVGSSKKTIEEKLIKIKHFFYLFV
jgi:hypothetical protein